MRQRSARLRIQQTGNAISRPANLVTMVHRAQEWPDTKAQLDIAFGNSDHFTVHDAVPPTFGDEGAANHMRLCEKHSEAGVEVFVYGRPGGKFPCAPA